MILFLLKTLNNITMKTLLLFCAITIASISNILSQDITISFSATGESTTIDEVKATNLTTLDSITIPGGESLTLIKNVTRIDELESEKAISVFPNPFGSTARIYFNNTKEQQVTLRLISISGKVLLSRSENLPAGTHQFNISAGRPGLYILSVISDSDNLNIKLIQRNAGSLKLENTGLKAPVKKATLLKSELSYTLSYYPDDVISYEIKSGDNVTVINETPTESKTVTAKIVTCKDYDGNNYKIVEIGTQVWMAEDLRTVHYPNGDSIPNVTDNSAWGNLGDNNTDDAYCFYNNKPDTCFGAIYTYAAAIADNWARDNADKQGVCPDDWHLPSDAEWTTLINYLGGEGVAGGKMKEPGTTHWASPNTGADNSSGFTALPGGGRYYDNGDFIYLGEGISWWSASEVFDVAAFMRVLRYDSGALDRTYYYAYKSIGFYVRCVKD
jgi:uncharacterized protein (TIGR02145 family)